MKIEEAKFETCKECKTHLKRISDEVYGCDQCRKPIAMDVSGKRHNDYLDLTVHYLGGEGSVSHQFCSWACLFEFLPTIKTDYFVSLPFLQYESYALPGQRASDFMECIAMHLKGE